MNAPAFSPMITLFDQDILPVITSGNSFMACLASLIARTPASLPDVRDDEVAERFEEIETCLELHGFNFRGMLACANILDGRAEQWTKLRKSSRGVEGAFICWGPHEGSKSHQACLYRDAVLLHDPHHPARTGLRKIIDVFLIERLRPRLSLPDINLDPASSLLDIELG